MAARQEGFLKRFGWLLLAAVLIAVAGWLMVEPGQTVRPRRPNVAFPRYPRDRDLERQRERRTLALRTVAAVAGAAANESENLAARDPVPVAIAGGQVAFVIEASVIKDSPIGRKLLGCLSPEERKGIQEFGARVGFDPLERVDRIAIGRADEEDGGLVVASGDFGGADLSALEPDLAAEPRGPHTTLYGTAHSTIARYGSDILLFGRRDAVLSAVERLEGEQPAELPFPSSEAYGEAYGVVSGASMADLVPSEFRDRVRRAVDQVMLHVDATEDLLMVANVSGGAQDTRDLGRSIGAALAVGRMRALESDERLFAELLDQSRVILDDSGFQLEMALPLSAIEEALGDCAKKP
jgi:hypothetical protein